VKDFIIFVRESNAVGLIVVVDFTTDVEGASSENVNSSRHPGELWIQQKQ